MGLQSTPSGERIHIGFFGLRNVGKSSLVNAVTGQDLSVVSDVKGTTTDPVSKAMELLPLGPVMIVDTPGLDDEGELGALRVKKAKQVFDKIDIAVLVVQAGQPLGELERKLTQLFESNGIPYRIAYNKSDLLTEEPTPKENEIYVSAKTKKNIWELKELIGSALKQKKESYFVRDLLSPNDIVLLVTPIDSSAPKGRLILPQQQALRDILDANATAVVVQLPQLKGALEALNQTPALVITDSQVFAEVSKIVPNEIPLTSFSILMARYKGFLNMAVTGVLAIANLKDGDTVLIAEGCTHHRQCEDIGTVKILRWLKEQTGKDLKIETVSGQEFPEDLSPYALVIHCGGCMLNPRAIQGRMRRALSQGVPVTNYGTFIAFQKGILQRSLRFFPEQDTLLKSAGITK